MVCAFQFVVKAQSSIDKISVDSEKEVKQVIQNMFIVPKTQEELDNFKPDFFFKLDNLNFISFFPLSFFNQKTRLLLDSYLVSLIFLLNVRKKIRL